MANLITAELVGSWEPCEPYTRTRLMELYGAGKTLREIAAGDVPIQDRLWTLTRVLIHLRGADAATEYARWSTLRACYHADDALARAAARAAIAARDAIAAATRAAIAAHAAIAARAAIAVRDDALDLDAARAERDARDSASGACDARDVRAAIAARDAHLDCDDCDDCDDRDNCDNCAAFAAHAAVSASAADDVAVAVAAIIDECQTQLNYLLELIEEKK